MLEKERRGKTGVGGGGTDRESIMLGAAFNDKDIYPGAMDEYLGTLLTPFKNALKSGFVCAQASIKIEKSVSSDSQMVTVIPKLKTHHALFPYRQGRIQYGLST